MHARIQGSYGCAGFTVSFLINRILCLIGLTSLIASGYAQSNVYTVAVIPFTVTDLTAQDSNQLLGEALPNYFPSPIAKSQKFKLVNRNILDKIIEEISLSEEGLTGENIQRFGELYGVDIFIGGSITIERQGEKPYVINANFTDASTAEIKSASLIRAKNETDFETVAEQLINEAIPRFPLRGEIFEENGQVFITLGTVHGLTPQDKTGIIYRDQQVRDRSITERIGTFTIELLGQDTSRVIVQMDDNNQVQENDVITIESLDNSLLTVNEAEPGEDPVSTESLATGFVFISGSPDGAVIFFQDQAVGTLRSSGTELELPAVTAELRIEAEGFRPKSEIITIEENRFLNLSISGLEPLTGALTIRVSNQMGDSVRANIYLINEEGREEGYGLSPRTIDGLRAGTYSLRVESEGYQIQTAVIRVTAGEAPNQALIRLEEELLSTILTLRISPDSLNPNIVINGQEATEQTELPLGTHSIEVKVEGFKPYLQEITLSSVEPQSLEIVLEPLMATLRLELEIEDAVIKLNGTPVSSSTMQLEPGQNHTLEVSAGGYRDFITSVNLKPGEQKTLAPELQSEPLTQTATLGFNVFPRNATVKVNGDEIATTEVLTLEAGVAHSIEVTAEGYESYRDMLVLEPDAVKTQLVRLDQIAVLTVDLNISPADAILKINGSIINERSLELTEGEYEILVEAERYESFIEILKLTESKTLDISLIPQFSTLTFNVIPPNALIEVGGQKVETNSLEVPPDQDVDILIQADGYVTQTETVTLKPGEQRIIDNVLEGVPAFLNFDVTPSAAKITVGGRLVNTNIFEVPSKQSFNVVIEAEGYSTYTTSLNLEPGENRTVQWDLESLIPTTTEDLQSLLSLGGAIHLPAGSYDVGDLVLEGDVELIGEGRNLTFVFSSGISHSSGELILRNLSLKNNSPNSDWGYPLLYVDDSILEISDSTFDGFRGWQDGLIAINSIVTISSSTFVNHDDGIVLSGDAIAIISSNIIRNNRNDGIRFSDYSDGEVRNNTISRNGGDGIDIDDQATVDIFNNSMSQNAEDDVDFR